MIEAITGRVSRNGGKGAKFRQHRFGEVSLELNVRNTKFKKYKYSQVQSTHKNGSNNTPIPIEFHSLSSINNRSILLIIKLSFFEVRILAPDGG